MPPGDLHPQAGEHPLAPLVRWGRESLPALRSIQDYTSTFVKRERIDGRLGQHEYFELKVRQQPFSVYVGKLGRDQQKTQESIYVEGANRGMMWVHSERYRYLGTLSLYPDSPRVMRESRHPVTSAGIVNLVEQLTTLGEAEIKAGPCDVQVIEDTKINGRPCLCVVARHDEQRPGVRFHLVRVFIDRELNVPVRYESYWFPAQPGGKPALLEEYTYLNLQFNQQLSGAAFDIANGAYRFPPLEDQPVVAQTQGDREPAAKRRAFKTVGDGHPLRPVLALLEQADDELQAIGQYECLLTMRQSRDGRLQPYQHLLIKQRLAPEGLYMRFLGPGEPRGREVLAAAGKFDEQLLLGEDGATVSSPKRVAPGSAEAREGLRRPINELTMSAIVRSFREQCERETRFGECNVYYLEEVLLDKRPCMCVVVTHPMARKSFRFNELRFYFDRDHNLLTRVQAYDWPRSTGQLPQLVEEYNFRNVQRQPELIDLDFDPANPEYGFSRTPRLGKLD
ncbi:MAG: DUF1571 domain-containing protein [Pirellulales bacterium]|nr:DUF1571 domain-containing protein [Pirellulales bacterium]